MRDLLLLAKLSELSPIPATGESLMKNRSVTLFTILLALVLLAPATTANSAGRTAKTIANTILNGKGAPKISVGIDGDFYIDTRSMLMYGPKKKGRWPIPSNLQGPTGPSGATGTPGKSGNDGKTISSASTIAGPQGPIGPAGPQGLIGLPGASGPAGPAGPAGKDGAPGSSGPAGSSGGSGPAGATGPVGATGPAGATGATGAQGPAGPSEVTVVEIPEWILSSAMPFSYSNSLAIGNLVAGNSYQIKIHLSGVSAFNDLVLGIDLIAPDSTFKFSYSRDDFRFATYTSSQSIYTFDVHATVTVGVSNSHLMVRVIDAFGDTGSSRLTLKGTAYITLVGSIK
jgi:hypothetical protein